jgi:Protein of unknown function (DUF3489)
MKRIPVNSHAKLHVMPAAARRQPPPPLVSTTVDLTHGASHELAATQTAAPHIPAAIAQTGRRRPPAGSTTGSQSSAGKKARVAPHRPDVAKGQPRSAKRPSGDQPARKAQRGATAREGTKKETMLALLRRSQGATLAEMMAATGWQSHSVRGFLSGALRKKMALKVKSGKRDNGERVYSVRG